MRFIRVGRMLSSTFDRGTVIPVHLLKYVPIYAYTYYTFFGGYACGRLPGSLFAICSTTGYMQEKLLCVNCAQKMEKIRHVKENSRYNTLHMRL